MTEGYAVFGTTFQENLVKIIFWDRSFADQISEVLEIKFFELVYLQTFLSLLFEYRKKYEKHPSVDIMQAVLDSRLPGENQLVKEQVLEFFKKVREQKIVEDAEYIKETAVDFAKKQDLKAAMISSIELMKSSSFDQISKLINTSLAKGLDNNLGHEYITDFDLRYENQLRNPISTGWKELDNITQGGLGAGEMGIFIGSSGAGKSFTLVNIGAAALKSGKNVIYYTLELSDNVIGKRFDSYFTRVQIEELVNHKENIFNDIKNVPGRLIIKKYPQKCATTQTIDNHIEKCIKRGFKPDLVLVDYGDKLKPIKNEKEKRHDLETIYEELRNIAEKYSVPLWNVSQSNRDGAKSELLTMESISEAYSKVFPCDFIAALTRTVEDRENNTARFFVAKNRFGLDGIIFPCYFDLSRAIIEVYPSDYAVNSDFGKENKISPVKAQQEKIDQIYSKLTNKNYKN
jgi:DNA replication protein DnaC